MSKSEERASSVVGQCSTEAPGLDPKSKKTKKKKKTARENAVDIIDVPRWSREDEANHSVLERNSEDSVCGIISSVGTDIDVGNFNPPSRKSESADGERRRSLQRSSANKVPVEVKDPGPVQNGRGVARFS